VEVLFQQVVDSFTNEENERTVLTPQFVAGKIKFGQADELAEVGGD
jgi:hypothetical protein